MAYHWRWLVKRVYKPQLIWWKRFPKDRLGWLLSEIQHFPIYVYLQTVREPFHWGWLISWFFFQNANCVGWSPISRVASCRGFAVSRTWNEFLWHYQQGVIESYYSLLSASELQALIHFYLSQRIQYMNLIFINHNLYGSQLHRQSPSQGWSSDWKHSNKLEHRP